MAEASTPCTPLLSDLSISIQPEEPLLGVQSLRVALQPRGPSPGSAPRRHSSAEGPDAAAAILAQETSVSQPCRLPPPVSLLCNWGACDDVCIATLLDVLGGLGWATPKPKATPCPDTAILDSDKADAIPDSSSTSLQKKGLRLFDLGCGDGRVLIDV